MMAGRRASWLWSQYPISVLSLWVSSFLIPAVEEHETVGEQLELCPPAGDYSLGNVFQLSPWGLEPGLVPPFNVGYLG